MGNKTIEQFVAIIGTKSELVMWACFCFIIQIQKRVLGLTQHSSFWKFLQMNNTDTPTYFLFACVSACATRPFACCLLTGVCLQFVCLFSLLSAACLNAVSVYQHSLSLLPGCLLAVCSLPVCYLLPVCQVCLFCILITLYELCAVFCLSVCFLSV